MDETFVGGKFSNMHKSNREKMGGKKRGVVGKTIVVGMLKRNGRVKAEVMLERTKPVLHALAKKHIAKDATLMTDEWGGSVGVGLQHVVINHAEEFARGLVLFWLTSFLERTRKLFVEVQLRTFKNQALIHFICSRYYCAPFGINSLQLDPELKVIDGIGVAGFSQ
jgi:hypothetical protein